mmetsp:Transcript_41136/g.116380  ORF Transcript_41136/g.116380 Transcript_41136/m.116380 type:complete len:325 (-) Transcript_41136:85-1059(-)
MLHGVEVQRPGDEEPRAAAGRGDRLGAHLHLHRRHLRLHAGDVQEDRVSHGRLLQGQVEDKPANQGRHLDGEHRATEHPGALQDGHVVLPFAAYALGDRWGRIPWRHAARLGLRQRGRGPAGLLHEVRLQRGGHQPHRRDQQARPQELLGVGREAQGHQGVAAGRGREAERGADRRGGRAVGRGGHGDVLRRARRPGSLPQGREVRPPVDLLEAPEALGRPRAHAFDPREGARRPEDEGRGGGAEGQGLLLLQRAEPAQDDDADALLPRGELLPRRQPLRPPALPAVRHLRRSVRRRGPRRQGGGRMLLGCSTGEARQVGLSCV